MFDLKFDLNFADLQFILKLDIKFDLKSDFKCDRMIINSTLILLLITVVTMTRVTG